MKQYDYSSNNMIVDEIIWLFIKQYDYSWNNIIVHIKFQVPNAIFWYYKYSYNNIRKPNMRVCLPWLNLLHNRYPHLETLGGSVSFQSGINIFSLFIYKLHQQLLPLTYLFILVGARTCHHIFSESTTKKKGINHNFLLKA